MEQNTNEFKIHICDDIQQHALDLKENILQFHDDFPSSISISLSSDELLSYLPKATGAKTPDIIFMDIRMPENDGITLGKMIKELCPDTYLVFTTAYAEYAIKGYEAAAFRYLLKPIKPEALQELFTDIIADSLKSKKIFIKGRKNSAFVSLQDILYICAEDKYAIVYTKRGHFISDMSLNKYEEQLKDYGFYRIHRKCLVNTFHHRGMCSNRVEISDGTILPISKSKISSYKAYVFSVLHKNLV